MLLQSKTLPLIESYDFLFITFYFLYSKIFKYFSHYKVFLTKKETVSQHELRLMQKKHKEGMLYFVNSSSCWNHFPQLPEDVNKLIVQNIDYDGHLWCEICQKCVLAINNDVMNVKKLYKCLDEKYICNECHEKSV